MESIRRKLRHIYTDLEHNVTKIFGRHNLHLAVDMVYHAPLEFRFCGDTIRGYPELFVLGDTRCGKSQIAARITQHYQMGAITPCEAATYAGIVGGMEKEHDRWVVKWGKIPMNHRRLLFLDEVTGFSPELIANMSMLRSTGIAELSMIKSERTNAKTRLIWMSNPRDNQKINSESYAITHLRKIVDKPEDQARFDFAIVVAEQDVSYTDDVNKRHRDPVPHTYTTNMCRNLVLWCWSRMENEVQFTEKALDACFDLGEAMRLKYHSDFPLVVPSEQKIKLARCAAGLAGRLFSCDSTGRIMVVTDQHVQTAYEFMNMEYDRPMFGYDEWSEFQYSADVFKDPEKVWEVLEDIGPEACHQIMSTARMGVKDMEEITGRTREEAKVIISQLSKYGAYKKPYTNYIKTPAFNLMLKKFIRVGKPKKEEF